MAPGIGGFPGNKYIGKMLKVIGTAGPTTPTDPTGPNPPIDPTQDPKTYTPPPIICPYEKVVRLSGDMGLSETLYQTVDVINECTGKPMKVDRKFHNTIEAIPALACIIEKTLDGEVVVEPQDAVIGNEYVIPADATDYIIKVLPATCPGARLQIGGFIHQYCCPEDFARLIARCTGPVGQETLIKAGEGMHIEICIACELSIEQETIEIPPRIIAASPHCVINKDTGLLETIKFTVDNCGDCKYITKAGDDITELIDVQYCWPENVTQKVPGEVCTFVSNDDTAPLKKKEIYYFQQWYTPATQEMCWTKVGDVPNGIAVDAEGTNLIDITKYTKMNITELAQQSLGSTLTTYPIPYPNGGITICHTNDDQDIIALIEGSDQHIAFVADMAAKFPDLTGGAWAIRKLRATQIADKIPVRCDLTGEDITTTPAGKPVSYGGLYADVEYSTPGKSIPFEKPVRTKDFVTEAGLCVTANLDGCQWAAGDIIPNGPVGTATKYDYCIDYYCPDPSAVK